MKLTLMPVSTHINPIRRLHCGSSRYALPLLLVGFVCPRVFAQTPQGALKEARREITPEEAKRKALAFLPRQGVWLTQRGFSSWGTTAGKGLKCYHFEGPEEESLYVEVDAVSGDVRLYSWLGIQGRSQRVVLTLQQAQSKVEQFLNARTDFLKDPHISQKRAEFLDHRAAGKEYTFEWKKIINGVQYPFGLAVSVSAQTGEVVGFQIAEDEVKLPSLEPVVSRERVLSLVQPKISFQPQDSLEATLFVTSRLIGQKLMWRVIAKGTQVLPYSPENGQIAYAAVTQFEVDASTGEISTGEIISGYTTADTPRRVIQLRPPNHPLTYTAVDYWPLLTSNASRPVFFLTSRKSDGYRYSLGSARGQQLSNLFKAPGYMSSFDWAAPTQRLTFAMSGTIYVLDLQSGALGHCNDSQRASRSMPSWDGTGHLIAMSGTHSPADGVGSQDADIFVARIADSLSRASMREHWCLSVLPGNDTLPVFAPDNRQIAFAHQDVIKQKDGSYQPVKEQTWSIYLADAAHTKGPSTPPRKVSTLR